MGKASGPAKERKNTYKDVHPEMRLYFAKENLFFGPGVYELLQLIEEKGTLRAACEAMEISYSKGWKRLASVEAQLGKAIVEKRRGGAEKGQSHLTESGKALVEGYRLVLREAGAKLQQIFDEYVQDGNSSGSS